MLKILQKFRPHSLLVFDLETVRAEPTLPLEGPLWSAWSSMRINAGKSVDEIVEAYRDTAALYPEFAKIVAFSAGAIIESNGNKPRIVSTAKGSDECELLLEILAFFEHRRALGARHVLAGMAICGFDIPFIAKRCLYHQIEVPEIFDLSDVKPWESGVFDLMNVWKMTSFYPATLSTICYGLGVPSPKLGAVKGSNVGDVYYDPEVPMEDKLIAISSYCSDDVLAVLNVIVALYKLPQSLDTSVGDG